MTEQIGVGVIGAGGRMGQEVIACVNSDPDTVLQALIEHEEYPYLGETVPGTEIFYSSANDANLRNCQVLISFTTGEGAVASLECAARFSTPLVVGATGVNKEDMKILLSHAQDAPLLVSSNMSLGVNLLFHLTRLAGKKLSTWHAEVLDMHHEFKLDAPSGTADKLIEILQQVSNNKELNTDRTNRSDPRPDEEIGVACLRGGDVVGEHTVYLLGNGERLELIHRATNRANFAQGALTAAKFIYDKEPGRYSMDDVLGLNSLS